MWRSRNFLFLALGLWLTWTLHAAATTWLGGTVKCPVCGAKVKIEQVMSYGDYLYLNEVAGELKKLIAGGKPLPR